MSLDSCAVPLDADRLVLLRCHGIDHRVPRQGVFIRMDRNDSQRGGDADRSRNGALRSGEFRRPSASQPVDEEFGGLQRNVMHFLRDDALRCRGGTVALEHVSDLGCDLGLADARSGSITRYLDRAVGQYGGNVVNLCIRDWTSDV